jgi:ketosteroid isomerase-like protein
MSQENVEIAQRLFEEFNRTFTEGTGDLYALIDPDVEWIPINAMLEGTTYQGHEGVRQWIEDVKRDWAEFEARPEHFLDLGDDGVLALGSWRARGRGGDVCSISRKRPGWGSTREGRIVRMQTFTERKKALEAAGLSE